MKNVLMGIALLVCFVGFSQDDQKAKDLLDAVSEKMGSYDNMYIEFSSNLVNEEAGISENDEPPILGKITLQKEKYNLDYLGNKFIFDGKKLYVINTEDKEVTTNDGDMDEGDGFIYPSKLLTFYKEGYNFSWGTLATEKGRKIQYVKLIPIDSASEIKEVQLGIDNKTNHIYKLIQIGANGSKTTFKINAFKSNQELSKKMFVFDKEKYLELDYIID
ncbi:outer membrane lipoprotein carrier protein LolA [Flavobacteriaceae bacterium S356]|uniref:Outer membrane lipoprotein carrier protein LolA n=1 Tax=Asprobacillus argus TaxID=3076534 RepID=A0ABU3LEB2_9FLAO|nr:outer membrane lipoprotein carrier protein LolA [Flavobacteriaceae bacterium S356]